MTTLAEYLEEVQERMDISTQESEELRKEINEGFNEIENMLAALNQ